MSFLHPEFLYLMLPPVLVLFYFILTQERPTAQLFSERIFARLQVNEKRLTPRQRNTLYLFVFILLIIAMAQPVITEMTVKARVPAQEVTVALDISASMQTRDLYPSRLAVAKQKLMQFIESAKTERIGILAFGKDVYVLSPPSSDKAVLRQMLRHFEPDAYAQKGTDIMALLAAADSVMKKSSSRNLLLLSDGGDKRDFSDAAAYAKEKKIRLFILGTATQKGGVLTRGGRPVMYGDKAVVTALNPGLEALAEATGGYYLPAVIGSDDITAMTAAIRTHEAGSGEGVKEIRRYGQLFIIPLGFALLLLLIANASMSRRERVAVPPAVLFGLLLFGHTLPVQAVQFDYELLEDANRYYARGQYLRAANTYYRYGKHNDNDAEAMYNSAHALYRSGNYEAAAELWGKIHTKKHLLQFAILHNLGNARAKLGGEKNLATAIKAYTQALHLQNDPQTRENLEIVRGRLMRLMRKKTQVEAAPKMQPGKRKSAGKPMEKIAAKNARDAAPDTMEHAQSEMRPSEGSGTAKRVQMSDYEAAMWVKTLQQQRETHLYKITPETAKGEQSVTPW